MQSTAPVWLTDRVQLLDVLRGFAILGIFMMNLYGFSFYWAFTESEKAGMALARYDETVSFLHIMIFEGKFYSIFSLLFGVGFAIYLKKSGTEKNVLRLFKRRVVILLFIGIFHLLLWSGDIVSFYAILGFLLIPFRRFSNKELLILAGFCILSPIAWYALRMTFPGVLDVSQQMIGFSIKMDERLGVHSEKDLANALAGTDIFRMVRLNLDGIIWRYGDLLFQSRHFKVFGMFLVGFVVGRSEFYKHLAAKKSLLIKLCLAGFIIGLPANYFLALFQKQPGYYQLTANGMKQTIAYAIGVAPLAMGYCSLLALLYIQRGVKIFLDRLAPVGRMALTNYLMHTFIGILVFTKLGFGIQNWGPAILTIFALVVFAIQVLISTWWLRYFRFGPVEWIWRQLTYGNRMAIKKQNSKNIQNQYA